MDKDEIFKIKILALLHDPPWKPWSITGKIEGSGRALTDDFLREFNVEYYDKSEVHENEGLTFAKILGITDDEIDKYINIVRRADRFSASIERFAVPKSEKVFVQKYKYNVFNPNHRIELRESIEKKCIQDYVRWVAKNLKGSWEEKYNTLYALIEVAWYHFCPSYPLADTRIGNYSVFDHLYATASMVNWFLNGDLSGYMVKVDLPGIQQIISKARKAWDFWGGSYLLSWLTYKTISPLIKAYGVDVVLSPFMGLNPFFVSELNIPREINGEDTYWEFNDLMFNPTQPLMPATVLLALPKVEDIKGYYEKAWKEILSITGNDLPPITPARIRVVNVSSSVGNYDFSKFMSLLKAINDEDKVVKVFYGVTASSLAFNISKEKYERKELYNLCTSCGVLPAEYYKDEDLEEGERLCGYCYMKRKLHKYLESKYKMQLIPSTIDIANIYNWRDILKNSEEVEGSEEIKKLKLPEPLKDLDSPLTRLMFYYGTVMKRLMLEYLNKGSLNKEEIYYAIVKGDGDFVGSKLWKGILKGKGLKDYLKRISSVEIDVDKIEEEVRRTYNVKLESDEFQIPVTPDYLITLSRSLMVIALKDALTVSKDGFLIYAGGDDVAFLAPISKLSALKLVMETRLNYWGASKMEDLTLQSSEGALGFLRFGKMIFDAPIAYGRSYGVYVTHYKDPFFYSWEIATRLEEMKDNVEGKDVTIILRGRGELNLNDAVIIKNSKLKDVEVLYNLIKVEKKVSKSFIKDVLGDEIISRGKLIDEVIKYYIKRNSTGVDYTPSLEAVKAVDYLDDNYMG